MKNHVAFKRLKSALVAGALGVLLLQSQTGVSHAKPKGEKPIRLSAAELKSSDSVYVGSCQLIKPTDAKIEKIIIGGAAVDCGYATRLAAQRCESRIDANESGTLNGVCECADDDCGKVVNCVEIDEKCNTKAFDSSLCEDARDICSGYRIASAPKESNRKMTETKKIAPKASPCVGDNCFPGEERIPASLETQ